MLVLPKPEKKSNRKRKPALTVCLTDNKALEELKTKEKEKIAAEETKKAKQLCVSLPPLDQMCRKADYVCLTLKMRRITPYAQNLAWCAKMTQIGFGYAVMLATFGIVLKRTDIPSKNCVADIFIRYKCVVYALVHWTNLK